MRELTQVLRFSPRTIEDESFRVQAYRFEAEAFKPAGQPCVVNVHSLHGEDLVVLGIPGGVELWLEPEFDV